MPSARLRNRMRQISRSDLIARSTRRIWKARNSLAACNPPAGTLASKSIQPQRMKRSLSSASCRRIQKSMKKKKHTMLSRYPSKVDTSSGKSNTRSATSAPIT